MKPGNRRMPCTHLMRLRRKLGEDAASPRYNFAEPRACCRMPEGKTERVRSSD